MTKKLQVSLRRDGSAIAVYPVRVEHTSDIERGLSEALVQFANTLPDAVIGERGVTLTMELSEASEL